MSDIKISPYSVEHYDTWNDFVKKSNNGTLFHRLDFLAYHQDRFQGQANHVLFEKKGNIIGVMPLGFFEEDGELTSKSPFGASYGGIVTLKDCTLVEMEQMADLLIKFLKHHAVKRLKVVLPPLIYHQMPDDYFDFCLIKNKAVVSSSDLTSYIPVVEGQIDHFLPRARRDSQKAIEAGLRLNENNDVGQFYAVLEENMKKFEGRPTHSLSEVQWLVKHLPDEVKIFNVCHGTETIASALLFICNPGTWLVFYWAQRQEHLQLHPKNFLILKLSELALARNVKYIDFGPHTLNMVPFYGVTMFKESLGGRGLLRKSYVLNLI